VHVYNSKIEKPNIKVFQYNTHHFDLKANTITVLETSELDHFFIMLNSHVKLFIISQRTCTTGLYFYSVKNWL